MAESRAQAFLKKQLGRLPEAEFSVETLPDAAEGQLASALSLTDDKKADVLLSLLEILHQNLAAWTTRAHETITWTVGLTFTIVSFVFVYPEQVTRGSAVIISTGLVLFGLMVHLYVRTARRAYSGNRLGIVKCEAALKLYAPGAYFERQAFFQYSKSMQRSQTLRVLSILHAATTLFAIALIIGRALFK